MAAAILLGLLVTAFRDLAAAFNRPAQVWHTATGEEKSYEDLLEVVEKKGSLEGAKLAGVSLVGADMSNMDLSGAVMDMMHCQACLFRRASLSGTSVVAARLEGSDFMQADLAGRLTSIGTWLLLLSLFAPVLSTLAYVWTVPTARDLAAAQALGKEARLSAEQITQIAGRDWHILLSGLSFGLLLLAAARGVMKQEQQQREVYFRLARRVASFENMISALRISERLEKEGQAWQMPSTLETIISRLLQPEPLVELTGNEKEDSKESISAAVEAFKSLK